MVRKGACSVIDFDDGCAADCSASLQSGGLGQMWVRLQVLMERRNFCGEVIKTEEVKRV